VEEKTRALLLRKGKKEVDRREGREEEGICRTNVKVLPMPLNSVTFRAETHAEITSPGKHKNVPVYTLTPYNNNNNNTDNFQRAVTWQNNYKGTTCLVYTNSQRNKSVFRAHLKELTESTNAE